MLKSIGVKTILT